MDFKISFILLHISLALWTGGMAMFTFVVTPVIFKYFPRDTASRTVDKLFPLYFPYNLITSVLALFFDAISGGTNYSIIIIAAAVLINLFIILVLYPAIKKTKFLIPSFEKTAPPSPARKRFSRWHAVSAVLNLLLLAIGLALIVIRSAS
ncbi:MAG: DUF4149 domain-containing protein [Nitrospiraceae bacterium]|nr:DUF4149 domain-containing protein [Nitrospiraceae bacterium]